MYTRNLVAFFIGILLIPVLSTGTNFALAQSEIQKLQGAISDKTISFLTSRLKFKHTKQLYVKLVQKKAPYRGLLTA